MAPKGATGDHGAHGDHGGHGDHAGDHAGKVGGAQLSGDSPRLKQSGDHAGDHRGQFP